MDLIQHGCPLCTYIDQMGNPGRFGAIQRMGR